MPPLPLTTDLIVSDEAEGHAGWTASLTKRYYSLLRRETRDATGALVAFPDVQ